ncbi:hypothetical protein NB693_20770 [Pantoea ananatis]|uniref:hypothetical protein n=1 Tax=Pantoea ananas TaxID=553 RepID=UPI00222003A4|nr:hypothetical protein [Pantoea ananatis]
MRHLTHASPQGAARSEDGSAHDSGQLAEFSQRLATATDSHIAAVMTHDASGSGGRLDLLLGADPAFVRRYEQEIAAENVWMQHGDAILRTGAVCDSDKAQLLPGLPAPVGDRAVGGSAPPRRNAPYSAQDMGREPFEMERGQPRLPRQAKPKAD